MTNSKLLPELSRLQEVLEYREIDGSLIWRVSRRNRIGAVAGTVEKVNGYIQVYIDGSLYKAHRLVWLLCTGEDPGEFQLDHINCNRCDNRIDNLRKVTNQQNQMNLSGAQSNSKSGVLGVSWHKATNKWRAKIVHKGKQISLGLYKNIEDATAARIAAETTMFGEYAPNRC